VLVVEIAGCSDSVVSPGLAVARLLKVSFWRIGFSVGMEQAWSNLQRLC